MTSRETAKNETEAQNKYTGGAKGKIVKGFSSIRGYCMAATSGQKWRHKELCDSLQHIMQKAKGGLCNQTCRPESGKRSRLKSVRKRGMGACFSYLWVDGLLTTGRLGKSISLALTYEQGPQD